MRIRLGRRQWFCSTVAGLALCAMRASAQTVVNLPAVQDATLLGGSDATTNNSLADPGMFVGTDGQGNPKRGLLQFNIASNIPAGATITAVTLQLTVGQVAGSGGGSGGGGSSAETIGLFDETHAWGQPANIAGAKSFGGTGHGAAPQNGDATWNFAFYNSTPASATPWTVAGGNWTASSTDIADAAVTGTLTSFTWSSPAMIADVQKWLNNPTSNFGWLLKNADETDPTDFRAFWSAQGAAANNAPATAPDLIVTFVPEPGGIFLLIIGAPLLWRRGRKIGRGCA